jgi:EpsI family protein
MLKLDKPFAGSLLVLGFLSLFPLTPPAAFHMDETKSPIFETFPNQLGEWKGKEAEVDARTYEILETRNVLSRNYTDSKAQLVHLLLVGSHKDRRVAHPPEVCFVSSNFTILEETHSTIEMGNESIPFKTFIAQDEKDPQKREQVLYLYKVGDRYTTNYYAQQLQFALDRLARRDSQVLLIRLAGPNTNVLKALLSEVLITLNQKK